jgi:hypothetical protein
MTMKRILHCTLMFMVLVMTGCDFVDSITGASQNTDSQNSHGPEWTTMSEQVESLLEKINSEEAAEFKVSDVAKAVQNPLSFLEKDNNEFKRKCRECSSEVLNKADQARNSLKQVNEKLAKQNQDAALNAQVKNEIGPLLQVALTNLNAADQLSKLPDSPTIVERFILPAKILSAVVVLILLAVSLSYLWKRSWRIVESNVGQLLKAHLAATREAQPDYAPRLSSLSSAQTEMSNRLTELDTEVRSLARVIRESLATRRSDHSPSYSGVNYHSSIESVSPKDEPEFPVSAVDYLGKMNRFANVVRPDFQNGILVNDPDGDGELVLIRDSRDDNQPFFVVPRATQFQTKQDFYTYYQKYYDCARPSAGDVWIIGPAVVEKVAGGWQLREKGMLEIR